MRRAIDFLTIDHQTRITVRVIIALVKSRLIPPQQIWYEPWDFYGIFLDIGRCEPFHIICSLY